MARALLASTGSQRTPRSGSKLAGTQIAEGKHQQEFDGRLYVMERGLRADLSVIHAWKSDVEGNLVYRKTARNFNPIMAMAAKVTIVEVDEPILPLGAIDPDDVHCSGIFVQRLDRKSTRLNSSHSQQSRMPSSA